jgi:hypothetical protein
MSPTPKKASEVDPQPSAARATEILATPDRERRAAEALVADAHAVEAQRVLGRSLEQRLAVLGRVRDDLDRWFQQRPPVVVAELEEALGQQRRAYIDRVVAVGGSLLERVTRAQAAARRLAEQLEQPLSPAALGVVIHGVAELEGAEPGVKIGHERWVGLRTNTAAALRQAATISTAQATWMGVEETTS